MLKYDLESHMFGIQKNLTWDNIREQNLKWWKSVGIRDPKEKPETKKLNYDVFLSDIQAELGLTTNNLKIKLLVKFVVVPMVVLLKDIKFNVRRNTLLIFLWMILKIWVL